MPTTADQLATLRAQLSGNFEEYEQRWQQLDKNAAKAGYNALVAAAFCEAVERRFAQNSTDADVIEFVGDVRSRSKGLADDLDPVVAERMIKAVYTDEDVDDIVGATKGATQMIILAALVADAQLNAAGLDELLGEARKLADEWIG